MRVTVLFERSDIDYKKQVLDFIDLVSLACLRCAVPNVSFQTSSFVDRDFFDVDIKEEKHEFFTVPAGSEIS